MIQQVAVLGATGSIGDSTLALLADHPERFSVYALSGHSRLDKLFALCQQFQPKCVVVPTEQIDSFSARIQAANLAIEVLDGEYGLITVAADSQVDTVVAAIVGAAGLASTLAAAQAGKRILLANKEALVMAGNLLMQAVRDNDAVLLPLDSEHNAIYQCLPAAVQLDNQQIHQKSHGVERLWLTASGGPFLHQSYADMQQATLAQAVKHPNWSMGQKISIDSATMMNKGLELIEACHLFDLPESAINVVIHPQSIVHSLVEYCDGSFLAQMGSPDMKTPIAHALSYPERIDSGVARLSLYELADLQFLEPDLTKFSCLKLAREAMQTGALATISLNAANEVAVQAFIEAQVKLTDIALIIERSLDKIAAHFEYSTQSINSLGDIIVIDAIARQFAADEVLLCQR